MTKRMRRLLEDLVPLTQGRDDSEPDWKTFGEKLDQAEEKNNHLRYCLFAIMILMLVVLFGASVTLIYMLVLTKPSGQGTVLIAAIFGPTAFLALCWPVHVLRKLAVDDTIGRFIRTGLQAGLPPKEIKQAINLFLITQGRAAPKPRRATRAATPRTQTG